MIQKILIGTNGLPPHVGGLENLTDDLALYLHKMGHDVTVVVSSDYGFPQQNRNYKTVTLDSLLLRRLPVPKASRRNFTYLSELRESKYDQIILQSHLFISNWILGLIFRKKSKLTWINYGGSPVKHSSKLVSKLIEIYEYLGFKILEYCCDRRLAQSVKSAQRLPQVSAKTYIINNCVPETLLDLPLRRGRIELVSKIIFVGRFVEDKRLLELLEQVNRAIKKLDEIDSSIQNRIFLSIIGNGPLKKAVLEFLKSQLKIDCVVKELPDRNSVISEMLSHDLLIQFPLSEGQPGVTLEALTVGLPILTTPIDECLQSLDGVFVCDSSSYASKLVSIMTSRKPFEVNVEINRQHLRAHHSVSETTRRILEIE
jgi:glycosyltransferase involved in cell wall biosynthesis